jgi:hypothetical protein
MSILVSRGLLFHAKSVAVRLSRKNNSRARLHKIPCRPQNHGKRDKAEEDEFGIASKDSHVGTYQISYSSPNMHSLFWISDVSKV